MKEPVSKDPFTTTVGKFAGLVAVLTGLLSEVTSQGASSDLALTSLNDFAPRRFEPGSAPETILFRVENRGPSTLGSIFSPVEAHLTVIVSRNLTLGDNDDWTAGSVPVRFYGLPTGGTAEVSSSLRGAPEVALPPEFSGECYLFGKVSFAAGSNYTDPNGANNSARLLNPVVVGRNLGESYLSFAGGNVSAPTIFPDSSDLKSFTFEAWIYPKAAGSLIVDDDAYTMVLFKDDAAANKGVGVSYTVWGSGSSSVTTTEFRDVTLNQWNHIALMFDAETKEYRLAINGKISSNPTVLNSSGFYTSPTRNFRLGDNPVDQGGSFNGYMDEVRISESVLYRSNFIPNRRLGYELGALFHFDEPIGATTFLNSLSTKSQLIAQGPVRLVNDPKLSISRNQNGVVVSWDDLDAQLEGAASVLGPWELLNGRSPLAIENKSPVKLFRLRK